MSDSKSGVAPSSTVSDGHGAKPGSNSTLHASPALAAAPQQGGYLSKLFGLGPGPVPATTIGRAPAAIDEAHEYHPGNDGITEHVANKFYYEQL